VNNLGDGKDPTSTTIKDKVILKVVPPGTNPDQTAVCDTSLLTALYGVIGALGTLVAVLVLTLTYLLCIGRRRKVEDRELGFWSHTTTKRKKFFKKKKKIKKIF